MSNKLKTDALNRAQKLKQEVTQKTISYITAAFGLVAGLAWNDAIKSLIELLFPESGNTIVIKFAYALILTIILVVVTIQLNNFLSKDK